MYIKEFAALHGLKPIGVLHIGAHEGEEAEEYVSNGFASSNPIIWVEAQENLVSQLKETLDPNFHKIYKAVAWDESDIELEFHVTSKSASSSVFNLEQHLEVYPEIKVDKIMKVKTSRLEEILDVADRFDFVVVDIQGAELQAIKGLGELITHVNWIFTEVSKKELYKGATKFNELEEHLTQIGYKRVFTAWDRKAGWGDALYARNEVYSPSLRQKIKIIESKIKRFSRSLVPQMLFPILVWIKRFIWQLKK